MTNLEHSLLKNCLNNEFYEANRSKLRPELFNETLKEIYTSIVEMHDKFAKDITSLDLFAYWKSNHPVWTAAQADQVEEQVQEIATSEPIDAEISATVINNLWMQEVANDIAQLALLMNQGDKDALAKINTLVERVTAGYLPDDVFGLPVTDDIYELLATTANDNRFKFNIETLSREVYGIGRGEFMIVAAYSNVGKTAFAVSISCGPAGFCQQGAKVGYVCNEEFGRRVKLRALQAYTGMTEDEIRVDPAAAVTRFAGIKDRIIFRDTQGWDMNILDAYLAKEEFSVVIVDMADKVELIEKFDQGHQRLRSLYTQLRALAKKHNVAIIAMSQATGDAEGRTRLSMSMLEGSRVAKQSEADLLFGIGKADNPDNPDDPTRYINIMKNKISGRHTLVQCNLEGEINRYVV